MATTKARDDPYIHLFLRALRQALGTNMRWTPDPWTAQSYSKLADHHVSVTTASDCDSKSDGLVSPPDCNARYPMDLGGSLSVW